MRKRPVRFWKPEGSVWRLMVDPMPTMAELHVIARVLGPVDIWPALYCAKLPPGLLQEYIHGPTPDGSDEFGRLHDMSPPKLEEENPRYFQTHGELVSVEAPQGVGWEDVIIYGEGEDE